MYDLSSAGHRIIGKSFIIPKEYTSTEEVYFFLKKYSIIQQVHFNKKIELSQYVCVIF